MQQVQRRMVSDCQFEGFGGRPYACLSAPDFRVHAEWDVVPVLRCGLHEILFYRSLVFAVDEHRFPVYVEYPIQGVVRIHQHIPCGRPHEHLYSSEFPFPVSCGILKFGKIAVGRSEVEAVIGIRPSFRKPCLILQQLHACRRRDRVGHVDKRCHSSEQGCP